MNNSLHSHICHFLDEICEEHQLPGIAVSIVKDGQPYDVLAVGTGDQVTQSPLNGASLFHMASISKVFVAEALMQLADREKVLLDDPVCQHLPYFRLIDERGDRITLRHLLTHTSGLPDVTDYHWDSPEDDDGALQRYVESLKETRLLFEPGQDFAYSNMAFEVAGDVIARLSGITFEQYIKDNLLEPLEMHSSSFLLDRSMSGLYASPHTRDLTVKPSPVYPYHRAHAPSSTLHSSAEEMLHWMTMNLSGGKFGNRLILPPTAHANLWQPAFSTRKDRSLVQKVGLGWFLGAHRGHPTVSHSGQDMGFTTIHVLMPVEGLGVTVLCNLSPAPVEPLALVLLDMLLGLDPQPIPPSIMISLGRIFMEEGFEAMKKRFLVMVRENPANSPVYYRDILDVGNALLDQGRDREALDLVKLAVQCEPGLPGGYASLARAYFQLGDFPKALEYLKSSLTLDPGNLFLRSQLERLQGK